MCQVPKMKKMRSFKRRCAGKKVLITLKMIEIREMMFSDGIRTK